MSSPENTNENSALFEENENMEMDWLYFWQQHGEEIVQNSWKAKYEDYTNAKYDKLNSQICVVHSESKMDRDNLCTTFKSMQDRFKVIACMDDLSDGLVNNCDVIGTDSFKDKKVINADETPVATSENDTKCSVSQAVQLSRTIKSNETKSLFTCTFYSTSEEEDEFLQPIKKDYNNMFSVRKISDESNQSELQACVTWKELWESHYQEVYNTKYAEFKETYHNLIENNPIINPQQTNSDLFPNGDIDMSVGLFMDEFSDVILSENYHEDHNGPSGGMLIKMLQS